MKTEAIISLDGVAVDLGGRAIFSGVSFSVDKGDFVAILGPNGAGKTTLFRLLLGLIKPAKGDIRVIGAVPHRGDPRIGYAPQHRVLETDLALRARDVVGFGLDGNKWGVGFGGRARTKRIEAVLAEVDALQFADAPVGKLSGGEQQRLLIAQALITDPQVLLLDEPLANLDISHAQEIIALLSSISKKRGATILLVTHDVNPLLPVANRVLYMAHGGGVMGTPEEVITAETLSALYGARVEVVRSEGRVFVVGVET